jgi:hypothetical protein
MARPRGPTVNTGPAEFIGLNCSVGSTGRFGSPLILGVLPQPWSGDAWSMSSLSHYIRRVE